MPHPIDEHVGATVRDFRLKAGMTQTVLANNIGVKFQQVQKYETGANRVSASRLADIATVLGKPISAFFPDDLQDPDLSATERDLVAAYRSADDAARQSISMIASKVEECDRAV